MFLIRSVFVLNLCVLMWKVEAAKTRKIQLFQVQTNSTSSILAHDDFTINNIEDLNFYSKWTSWTVCARNCRQIRIKYCLFNNFRCRGNILQEERFCLAPQLHCIMEQTQMRLNNSNLLAPTKGNHEHRSVTTSAGPSTLQTHFVNNAIDNANAPLPTVNHQIRIVKMSKHNTIPTSGIVKPHSLYTKWSSWSKCTRSCFTQRVKTCKRVGTCRKQVLRETAYCYVEGSPCHQWIQNRLEYKDDDEDEDEEDDRLIEPTEAPVDSFEMNIRENCGISRSKQPNSSGYYYSWPMLRIIGGRMSSKRKWPWQVAVLNKYKETFCGGTLISPRWVLTAAHCVRKRLYVRINEHDISYYDGTEQEYRVDKSIPHKNYDPDTVDNDIALLKLPIDISQSYACLPRQNQSLPVETMCTITGWGKRHMKDEHGANVLHEAQIPIVTRARCRSVYRNFRITPNMFCAGFKNGGHDTCAGDSGGPLLCQSQPANPAFNGIKPWVLHGVTSFGEGCGRKSKYGIYTAVQNYVNWIFKQIKDN